MLWAAQWTTGLILLIPFLFNPAIAAPAAGAASFYVSDLPNLPHNKTHPLHIFAGHLPSEATPHSASSTEIISNLYFVLTKARRSADRERLIIWFNGGPGCSSFDGLMMEVGPWRVDGKGGLKLADGGWEEYANVLYIDQPPGTGFSYASTDKYLHELTDASQHVIQFLLNFYDVFPEFKTMDTYLAGESYAGQYIPYIADAILKSTRISTPLKGAAIGNGWMDGRTQYPAYVEFSVKEGLLKEGSQELAETNRVLERCMKAMNTTSPLPPSIGDCESVLSTIVDSLTKPVNGKEMCINIYDIRLTDEAPACGMNWPPDLSSIYTYLRRPEVVGALHATAHAEAWVECQNRVSHALTNHKSPASVTLLPSILEKIPIMLFHGDQDLICNYVGAERLIESLEWNGFKGLGAAQTRNWTVDGTPAGTWVSARNLTYVKVFGASHMVPYDVPHVSHDMMLRFMGVDFSALAGGTAHIPSSVGEDVKPIISAVGPPANPPPPETSPSEGAKDDPAVWDAYYNAGSAALALLLIGLALGGFFYFRSRSKRKAMLRRLPVSTREEEETIPLSQSIRDPDDDNTSTQTRRTGSIKGKEREVPSGQNGSNGQTIFEVGDSDDEDDYRDRDTGRRT
ncbi:hypothetical protein BOTBODRAFT_179499 [Botryobasidium botryosum FD-172 SS1]|uniref:Carboxypeptidase n=1 Tax=Botryobasidium botryosum (strain FD-172 SS1) TaxID=930990 RepID=A0A067M040_BOTB1|nr:hypothetical protein BOTBODRAFT_179499 [Botryobasidium botryosum FD-172 SS1]